MIGDEIVSFVRYKDDHQGVVVAYWLSTGSNLASIDHTQYNIGLIQHFVKHSVSFSNDSDEETTEQHVFCYIKWKQHHPNANWFGTSAVLTDTINKLESACSYMSMQRIMHRCASGNITVNFGLHSETYGCYTTRHQILFLTYYCINVCKKNIIYLEAFFLPASLTHSPDLVPPSTRQFLQKFCTTSTLLFIS